MKTISSPRKSAMSSGSPPVGLRTISGCATFSELILATGGRHPTELLELLRGLDEPDPALRRRLQALIEDATTVVAGKGHPQGEGLALPHPMDFEWRFADGTADDLLASAGGATQPGGTILLMGVPSVVVAASRSNHDRRFAVVGEHNVISDGLRELTSRDARFDHGDSVMHRATAAILDPPWYPDQFCAMLAEAASNCVVGAHLFLSAPSEGVRPSIPDDLRRIDEMAAHCGLELVGSDSRKLKYRTPFFEMNALRAAGIGAWLPEWRRGDKRIYRKSGHGGACDFKLADRSGFEVTIAGVRLRLLDAADGRCTADLAPIHPGEIFPSVSMRAPRRSEAVLWTSGNRAFSVDHAACLAALAAIAVDRRLLPEGLYSKLSFARKPGAIDRIDPLIQKLLELAEREFAEATNVLGPNAWETAANDARFLSGSRRESLQDRAGTGA
jgi:hypothetical protein